MVGCMPFYDLVPFPAFVRGSEPSDKPSICLLPGAEHGFRPLRCLTSGNSTDLAIGNLTYAGAFSVSAPTAVMALNLGGATLAFPRLRLHLNWASPKPDHGLPNRYRGHAHMKQMRSSLKWAFNWLSVHRTTPIKFSSRALLPRLRSLLLGCAVERLPLPSNAPMSGAEVRST